MVLLGSLAVLQFNQKQGGGEQNSAAVTQTASKNENSTTQAVDKVKDAVVSIITYSRKLIKVVLVEPIILIQIQTLNKLTVKVPVLSIKKMGMMLIL